MVKRRRKSIALRLFGIAAGTCGAALVAFLGLLLILQMTVGKDLPPLPALQTLEQPTSTELLTRSGTVLHRFFEQNRTRLRLSDVPPIVVEACLATEDRPFYSHWGIHLPSILRAAVRNVSRLKVTQGGSTITQQLARDLFLTQEVTLSRKIREALVALRLEQVFTKHELLEIYLNQVYLGSGAYGVEAAARVYFGKDLDALTLGETALLAGLPAGPYLYDPRRDLALARQRRDHVLRGMLGVGVIDSSEFQAAVSETLAIAAPSSASEVAPYFVEEVRRDLLRRYGAQLLYRGGLTVHTTLDFQTEVAAESLVAAHLEALEQKVGKRDGDPLQCAVVVMDARAGDVIAMVGGRDFEVSEFNRVTQAHRQAGSSIKAFVYAAALERGIPTSHLLLDTPITMETPEGLWQPRNYDGAFKGPTTLREAWKYSRNVCAVRLFMEVGPERVIDLARRLGITTPILPYPSTAIGAADVIPIEMVRAYAVFANGGSLVEPRLFTAVVHPDGRREEFPPSVRRVLDARVAYMMMDLLRSTVDGGTGWVVRARGFGQPDGVVRVDVCRDSGLLARADCPEVVHELFLTGRQPTRLCDIHGAKTGELGSLWELQEREHTQALPEI
jgi:penicillin-binding protein 1A